MESKIRGANPSLIIHDEFTDLGAVSGNLDGLLTTTATNSGPFYFTQPSITLEDVNMALERTQQTLTVTPPYTYEYENGWKAPNYWTAPTEPEEQKAKRFLTGPWFKDDPRLAVMEATIRTEELAGKHQNRYNFSDWIRPIVANANTWYNVNTNGVYTFDAAAVENVVVNYLYRNPNA